MTRWWLPLAALLLSGPLAHAGAKKLPNLVVILADDMGIGDLGCYNKASKIPTPHMNRLARQGMRFLDAHTPSGVCSPTRYGLLTGRYCWRSRLKRGVLQGYDPVLIEEGRLTLAALLKRAGYTTACVGKWHLGLGNDNPTDYGKKLTPGPNRHGFDYFFGIPASLDMPPYLERAARGGGDGEDCRQRDAPPGRRRFLARGGDRTEFQAHRRAAQAAGAGGRLPGEAGQGGQAVLSVPAAVGAAHTVAAHEGIPG
jgi:arylsulfatase A-like enzyme